MYFIRKWKNSGIISVKAEMVESKRTPLVGEYNAVIYDALKKVGFSGEQAAQLVNRAAEQQLFYGLQSGMFLEKVPKRINLRR